MQRRCQFNAYQLPNRPKSRRSCRQWTPLGRGREEVLLDDVAVIEVAASKRTGMMCAHYLPWVSTQYTEPLGVFNW